MSEPVMRDGHAEAQSALLPDIQRGPTWTPDYMRDCLARWVAAQPPAPRRAFFETWERRHGHASAAALHAQAKAAFTAARGRA